MAADVDWREIKNRSLEALGQSKDIRLLVHLGTSELRLDGPSAYFDALVIADRWLKDFWAQAIAAMDPKSVTLATVQAETAGDGVVEIGRAELTTNAGQTVHIKYVVHWKQEDGLWKWHTDIWNLNQ